MGDKNKMAIEIWHKSYNKDAQVVLTQTYPRDGFYEKNLPNLSLYGIPADKLLDKSTFLGKVYSTNNYSSLERVIVIENRTNNSTIRVSGKDLESACYALLDVLELIGGDETIVIE